MVETPLVVLLGRDAPPRATASAIGGKAAALARLIAAGHPVPRSVVVTTAAYRAFVVDPEIVALLARLRGPTADEIDDDEIDRRFLDAPLPTEVGAALDAISSMFDRTLAVRSSATSEDLSSSAFAGQYRSFLDVEPSDIDRAVRLVWASLWHASPRAYRRLRDIEDDELAMAVLVIEMIEPVIAGVLFTSDPVGDESSIRLETVSGTADALVSGEVTPDAFTWPRDTAPLAAAARLGPEIGELVARGLELEATWGTPLDIEFAIDRADRLWLVQARPVTTLEHAPAGSSHTLTRAGIAEMLPGVLPPLLRATAGRHVDAGFRVLLDDLGADLTAELDGDPTSTEDGDSFVRFDHSRALLDLERLRSAAATVPGGSVAALDRGYGAGRSAGPVPTARSAALQFARVMRHRRRAVVESEIVIQAIERLRDDPDPLADGSGDATIDGDDTIDALISRWERVDDLGARATAAEMAVAALATAAYEGVERTLGRRLGSDRARELAQRQTARRRDRTGPLVRCVTAELPHRADIDWRRTTWTTAAAALAEGADGRAFLARWHDGLRRSGSRSVFGGPTWEEDPDLAWFAFVADTTAATSSPPAGDARRDPALRGRFLRREIADATELLDRRERTKQALLDLGGIAHRLVSAIAERLATVGVLADASDIWLLTPTEIHTASASGRTPPGLPDRRAALARDLAIEVPGGAPTTGSGRGWPASPGVASGRAVVLTAPRAGAIGRGDVLVARNTDASWAPLFGLARAIVVEEGGPLSHAAIVARELGIPAVVNLPGIVARVRAAGPDAVVHVDGTSGAVSVARAEEAMPIPHLASVPDQPQDEPRLGVFVTGLIGASALFGVVVSITEAVSSARGIRRTRARAAIPATVVAEIVRHGTTAGRRATDGLASARRYGQIAVAAAAVAIFLAVVTTAEYVASNTQTRILWLVTGLTGGLAVGGGAHLARVARLRWPDVPPTVRRLSPGPRPHTTARQLWYAMPPLHRRWLTVLGSTAVALLVLNVLTPAVLRVVDEPLYDAIGAPHSDPWGPGWFGMYFGRPQVVIPAALLVALFTVRCRVLALAYPAAIAFGGALNLGLGKLIGKDRPPLGAHADQTDSFPSGHAIEVTLLLGLAPLAVAVLLRSRWFGSLVRLVASGVLAVMLIDGLREGSHWPTDHLGGFVIAMFAVVLVHALARVPALHSGCTRCPAMALRPVEPGDSRRTAPEAAAKREP